jgi:hypothetical protein
MIETRKLSDLVEDFDLYPRNSVDSGHISDLLRAINSGAALPPPIVCAKTGVIIDGFHRSRAWRRFLGPDGEIEVDARNYKNKRAMFLEAVELNSAHGRKLDRHDQARIVNLAERMRIGKSVIAVKLHVTEPAIERLRVRVVVNSETKERVPNKRGGEWLNESTLTPRQISEGIKPCRSLEVGRLAIELGRLLEHGLVNWSDEQIVERLRDLRDRLDEALAAEAA